MSESNEIGERLRRAMVARGLDQATLAAASGVDKSHISRLLKGDRGEGMRKGTRQKLADALKVTDAWLFAGVGPSPLGDTASPSPSATVTTEQMVADLIADSISRYPSKVAASAALRGVVSQQAIDAMMTEEHKGSTGDPGSDFWFQRGVWWEHKIRAGKTEVESGSLDEPPPMEPRARKKR